MYLQVKKKEEKKNNWFIFTLKFGNQSTREAEINKVRNGNLLRVFEAPRKVYGWQFFKLSNVNKQF